MHVFVTGGTGFIGQEVVRQLLQKGEQVVCLVRNPKKGEALQAMGAEILPGDITQPESMREAMRNAKAVYHIAGWYATGPVNRAQMEAINVQGARNTLTLAAEMGVPRILHVSTTGVYGNTHGQVVDESYRAPREALLSPYERTKWEAHYTVAVPLQEAGAPLIIAQPGGVTGPGDSSPHVNLFRFFLNRMPVMFGQRAGLTFAHVEDIAAGLILAVEKGQPGESYNLCGPAMTYREVFETCSRVSGIPATRIWLPDGAALFTAGLLRLLEKAGARLPFSAEDIRLLANYTFWASAEKAHTTLRWQPRPVEEVFRSVLEWLRSEKHR